jgi:succinoglycan biosynthesis protein ExoM
VTVTSATPSVRFDRVSVCICTFKRPELLERLLDGLEAQALDSTVAFDVVIVDNDATRSSEAVAAKFAARGRFRVVYDCEPERNISLTRNRAVRHATGDLIAFIDDDEVPRKEWLVRLLATMRQHDADGVLGPVLPDFPEGAPRWLNDGRMFDRKRHPTGTRIGPGDARTGNVLLKRALFPDGEPWFDPAFGRSGGEDSDFFSRKMHDGRTFIWCDEAEAYETVPPERWTASFHIKRLWRSGTISGERIRRGRLPLTLLARNVAVLAACTLATPTVVVLPKHLRVRVVQKTAYCAGMVAAFLGVSLLKYRD